MILCLDFLISKSAKTEAQFPISVIKGSLRTICGGGGLPIQCQTHPNNEKQELWTGKSVN